MKKTYSKSSRQGLPGGPNEMFEKVKGIIVSQRGQWDFPGMNTLVPTDDGRITMRGVPYPVYGQDETGYGQMMYPGQEYQFPGNNVLELPMAQRGLYVDPNDPAGRKRYKAYQDSLQLHNRYLDFHNAAYFSTNPRTKSTVARRYGFSYNPSNGMFTLDGVGREQLPINTNNVNSNIFPIAGWSYADPYQASGVTEFLAEYKKPVQPVKYKLDPEIVKKQKLLKEAGLYKGKIDGVWGTSSQKAWDNYQKQLNVEPVSTKQSNTVSRPYRNFARETITQVPYRNPTTGETETRMILSTPQHYYYMNPGQYSNLLPTDSIPREGNFLYRTNRTPANNLKKYGGDLKKFQSTGELIDEQTNDTPDSDDNKTYGTYYIPEYDLIDLNLPIYKTPRQFYERNKDLQTYFSEKDISKGVRSSSYYDQNNSTNYTPKIGNNPLLIQRDFSDDENNTWYSDNIPEFVHCTEEGCTARANRFVSSFFTSGSPYFQNPDLTKEYLGATFSAERPPTRDEIKRYPYAEGDKIVSLDAWDQVDAAMRTMPNNVLYSNIYVPKNGKITKADIDAVTRKNIGAGEIWKKYKIPIGSIINVGGYPQTPSYTDRKIIAGSHTVRVVGYTDTGEPLIADYGEIRPLSQNMYGSNAYVAGIITMPGNEHFTYDYFVEKAKLKDAPGEKADYYIKGVTDSKNVGNPLNPLRVFDNKKYSEEFVNFNNSIIDEANKLRSKLNISKEKYDQYAKIALTIAGTETEFGKGLFYNLFDFGESTGITQLNKKNIEDKYKNTLSAYTKGTTAYDAVATILYIKELDKYKEKWSQMGSKAQERPFTMKEGYGIKALLKKDLRELQGKDLYGYDQSDGRLQADTFTDEKGIVKLPFKQPWQSEEDFIKEVNEKFRESGREDLRFAFKDGKRTIFRKTLGNKIPNNLEDMVFYSWQSPSSYIYGDAQGDSQYYKKAKRIYNELFSTPKKQLGGSLPQFQYTGQFNPQLARPNPLTGKYAWEQNIPKKTAVNVAPKMQPAARATTNVQKQNLNLDRDNRLLDANLIYSDASSNPLSNAVHTGLDAVGMVPFIGEPADLANALLYNYEGDLENTALSTAGMIPFLGMLGTGKRLLGKTVNTPKQLPGSSNVGKGFKPEIDWSKWNPETPKHKVLIDEYDAIEEASKRDGTWMKNADGSPYRGTPEMFVHEKSSWFKKAYPQGYDESFRGVGIYNNDPDFSKSQSFLGDNLSGDRGVFTANKGLASAYAAGSDILTPFSKKYDTGLFNLIHPKGKQIIYDVGHNSWLDINLAKNSSKNNLQAQIDFTKKHLNNLIKNKDVDPSTIIKQQELLEDLQMRFDNFDNLNTDFNEFNRMRSVLGDITTTDNIAEYLPSTDLRKIYLKNIYDGGFGDVIINNNRPGNYLKSRVGNIGFYDLDNPHVYKSFGGSLPKAQMLGEFNPQLFQPNPITGLYNWEKPRVKPKLSDFEPKQKAAPRSSTSVATKSDPIKAARQINAAAVEEYERNRQGVIRATNRPVSVFRPGAGDPEAIMEFTGVPGAVRFVKSPVQSLKGAGNTIVDLGLTVSPFANMNPAAGFQYAKQGTNPLTGEGSFRPQDVEGAFNTLDAAGLATIVGAGLKAPLQQGLRQTGKYLTQGPLKYAFKTPRQLPGSGNVNQPVGNIFSKFKKIPDWVISEMRFNALPELNNKQANEVLENFRARIKTPEGQKRLKELGITDTRILDDLKILADDETLGHYWMQKIGLNPYLPEMKRVTRHEIEHAVQEARNISLMNKFNQDDGNFKYLFRPKKRKLALEEARRETTDIDELLKGLELRKTPENVDWNAIKSTRGKLDASRLFEYMSDKQRATNYFNSGSGGQEKSAFLAEVQQYMMDNNIIPKNSYVEVTPEMVKETFVDAMFDETGGGKYLRLFNIMKPTEANYKLISEGLNKMLGLAPFIGTGLGVYGVNQMQNAQPMQRFGGNLNFQDGGIKNLSSYGELQMYPVESGAGVLGEVGLDYQLPFGNSAYLSNSFNVEPGYGSYFNPGFGIEQPIGGNRGSFFMGAEMFDGAPRLNAGLKYRFEDGGSLPTAGDPVLNFIQSQSPRFSKSKK